MVRTSKSAPATPAPVAPAPAPVVEEKKVKTSSSKKEKSVAPAPAPAPTPVPAPAPAPEVAAAEPSTEDVSSMADKLAVFNSKLKQLADLFVSVKSDFKQLEKTVSRELKNAQKSSSRKKKSTGVRKAAGFAKPTRISDELAAFLGKEIGTEMSRTQVSSEIDKYIKAHSLQAKTNGRIIVPDAKLLALLKIGANDELSYFNLQRYMKPHFIKAAVVV
jgi:chromatin remodeling complex protein RSC6